MLSIREHFHVPKTFKYAVVTTEPTIFVNLHEYPFSSDSSTTLMVSDPSLAVIILLSLIFSHVAFAKLPDDRHISLTVFPSTTVTLNDGRIDGVGKSTAIHKIYNIVKCIMMI